MNHCAKHVHKDIDSMADNEYQHHHNRSRNDIIGAHTYCEVVEHTCKDTARKSEGKQAYIRQYTSPSKPVAIL